MGLRLAPMMKAIPDDDVSIDELQKAVEHMHGVPARFIEAVDVDERFNGEIVWQGAVKVFALTGHPSGATRAYAWSFRTEGTRRKFKAVLGVRPVDGPVMALRARILALHACDGRWHRLHRLEHGRPSRRRAAQGATVSAKRARIGRPPLAEGKARDIVFTVRVSPEERQAFVAAAERSGQPVTQWARDALVFAAMSPWRAREPE
jgi:hypothetical protein